MSSLKERDLCPRDSWVAERVLGWRTPGVGGRVGSCETASGHDPSWVDSPHLPGCLNETGTGPIRLPLTLGPVSTSSRDPGRRTAATVHRLLVCCCPGPVPSRPRLLPPGPDPTPKTLVAPMTPVSPDPNSVWETGKEGRREGTTRGAESTAPRVVYRGLLRGPAREGLCHGPGPPRWMSSPTDHHGNLWSHVRPRGTPSGCKRRPRTGTDLEPPLHTSE